MFSDSGPQALPRVSGPLRVDSNLRTMFLDSEPPVFLQVFGRVLLDLLFRRLIFSSLIRQESPPVSVREARVLRLTSGSYTIFRQTHLLSSLHFSPKSQLILPRWKCKPVIYV